MGILINILKQITTELGRNKQHNLCSSVLGLVGAELIFFIGVKCSAVFWICALNSADNIDTFSY